MATAQRQPWLKFYPRDWRGDQALRICSLAARGLWMEMLAIMHEADPYGHLVINGRPVSDTQLAALVGTSQDHVCELKNELEAAGVYSVSRGGVIYSRRMTRDEKKARTARKNGKTGGNPSLWNKTENQPSDNPTHNHPVKGEDKPQRPEARSQKKEEPPNGGSKKASGSRLPDDWWPDQADVDSAHREGLTDDDIRREAAKFRDYWLAQPGQRGRKADWRATWRNWTRKAVESRQLGPPRNAAQGRGRSPASVVDVTADLVSGRGFG